MYILRALLALMIAYPLLGQPVAASFEVLPRDLRITILAVTEPAIKNLGCYALVSKQWHKDAASDRLWQHASQKYFPFEIDFYRQHTKVARKILDRTHKRALKKSLQLSDLYGSYKLMVIWRLSIAKDLIKSYNRRLPDQDVLDKCAVAAELAGNSGALEVLLQKNVNKINEEFGCGEGYAIQIDATLNRYITLGSKVASAEKEQYIYYGILH